MVFKIFLVLFSLYVIVRAKKQYVKREVSRYWALMWSVVWIFVIVFTLFPEIIDAIAARVGVGRGADLLVYVSVVFLLYATHRNIVRQQRMSEEITELVRKIAIDHPEQH